VFDRLRREHSLKQLDLFVLVLQPTLQLDHLLRTVGAIASVRPLSTNKRAAFCPQTGSKVPNNISYPLPVCSTVVCSTDLELKHQWQSVIQYEPIISENNSMQFDWLALFFPDAVSCI